MNETKKEAQPDKNRDPLTGASGAHPVGVGLGSVTGASIGAVVGAAAGPLGTAVGATIGGVAGGLTGKGLAEAANPTDPTVEDTYWRENYASRPYVKAGARYEAYQPAYRLGWEGPGRYGELNWEKAEPRLREDWHRAGGGSQLDWDKASPAVKDAWGRLRDDADYRKENI
jgi:hypothetical protein